MAAHAGYIESIVSQITLTMCLLRLKKTLIACLLSYTISLITPTIALTMGLLRSQKPV